MNNAPDFAPDELEYMRQAGMQHQRNDADIREILTNFYHINARISQDSLQALIDDYDYAISSESVKQKKHLVTLRNTIRLISYVIAKDQNQLAGQLLGRLMPYTTTRWQWFWNSLKYYLQYFGLGEQEIFGMLQQAKEWRGRPWLQPLNNTHPTTDGLFRTFTPHSEEITDIAITTIFQKKKINGKDVEEKIYLLVSASVDGTVQVHDIETGELKSTFTEHQKAVRVIAISHDGQLVFSWGDDRQLRVWNILTGRQLYNLELWQNVQDIAPISNTLVATAGVRSSNAVWDLETGRTKFRFDAYWAVVVSPDSNLIAFTKGLVSKGAKKATFRVCTASNGDVLHEFVMDDRICGLTFSKNGKQIIVASSEEIKIWNVATGKLVRQFSAWPALSGISRPLSEKRYVLTFMHENIIVWDVFTGHELFKFKAHDRYLVKSDISTDVSNDDNYLATANSSEIKIWNFPKLYKSRIVFRHARARLLQLLETLFGKIRFFDTLFKLFKEMLSDTGIQAKTSIDTLAISPNGQYIVAPFRGDSIEIWNAKAKIKLHKIGFDAVFRVMFNLIRNLERQKPLTYTRGLLITNDNKYVIVALHNAVRIFHRWTGSFVNEHEYPGDVRTAVLTPDERFLIFGGGTDLTNTLDEWPLYVWEWKTQNPVLKLTGHAAIINNVIVTPDGKYVISSAIRGQFRYTNPPEDTIRIWEIESGRLHRSFKGHVLVLSLAILPNGRKLISASHNGTIVVWDLIGQEQPYLLSAKEQPKPNLAHSAPINDLAVTPDGQYAISASDDRTIRVWDIQTKICTAKFILENSAKSCVVSPDGQEVIVGDSMENVHFFSLVQPREVKSV